MSETDLTKDALNLLSKAEAIYQSESIEARARGEDFNIFDVLKIGKLEVTTHSRLLAELLNPKGTHGQGDVFLRLFMQQLTGDIPKYFLTDQASVQTEVVAGEFGRIDIVITDIHKKQRMFIENKIFANLGDRQLERYREYDAKAHIIYLTLHGDEPPVLKTIAPAEPLSYQQHIVAWLTGCREKIVTIPGIRELITHYLHFVLNLTNQNTSSRMNQKLLETILQNKSSYLAYEILCNSGGIKKIHDTLRSRLNRCLEEHAKTHKLTLVQTFGFSERGSSCLFTNPDLEKHHLTFGIEWETGPCGKKDGNSGYFFGVKYSGGNLSNILREKIRIAFENKFNQLGSKDHTTWIAWQWWEKHRYEDNDEWWFPILSGDFEKDMLELLNKLHEVANEALPQVPHSTSVATTEDADYLKTILPPLPSTSS